MRPLLIFQVSLDRPTRNVELQIDHHLGNKVDSLTACHSVISAEEKARFREENRLQLADSLGGLLKLALAVSTFLGVFCLELRNFPPSTGLVRLEPVLEDSHLLAGVIVLGERSNLVVIYDLVLQKRHRNVLLESQGLLLRWEGEARLASLKQVLQFPAYGEAVSKIARAKIPLGSALDLQVGFNLQVRVVLHLSERHLHGPAHDCRGLDPRIEVRETVSEGLRVERELVEAFLRGPLDARFVGL